MTYNAKYTVKNYLKYYAIITNNSSQSEKFKKYSIACENNKLENSLSASISAKLR